MIQFGNKISYEAAMLSLPGRTRNNTKYFFDRIGQINLNYNYNYNLCLSNLVQKKKKAFSKH